MSDDASLQQSPLHERHESLGAKFSAFGGWSMPLEYPSGVVKEHGAVRGAVGLFDVSHLGKVLVAGEGAAAYLNSTLTNDLDKIGNGQAQYTLCCDPESGGIVDDLIAYRQNDSQVLLVPNAANAVDVVRRLTDRVPNGIKVADHHRGFAVLAVQGPKSDEVLIEVGLPAGHAYMSFVDAKFGAAGVVVCRTGYTGERGYELITKSDAAVPLWDALLAAGEVHGITPCGLGARDTLRTEMGYPLHGQDIGLEVTPNQANLGWAVGWDKESFWGRDVLIAERASGPKRTLRGLVAVGKGIPRPGMGVTLIPDVPLCDITSGTFSPTLKAGVGMALVPSFVHPNAELGVDVRGRREIFQCVKPPMVKTSVRES
jgi:aminomethyltransferase